jgi:hypothetical protein
MADVSNIAHVSDASLLRILGRFYVVHSFLVMYTNFVGCWQNGLVDIANYTCRSIDYMENTGALGIIMYSIMISLCG